MAAKMKSYFSASLNVRSTQSSPGLAVPMVTMRSSPASTARDRTSSRSVSKSGMSRWACESAIMCRDRLCARRSRFVSALSSQQGAVPDLFGEGSKNRPGTVRCRHDHSVGFNSHDSRRLQIDHQYDLPVHKHSRIVDFGDARDDLADLAPDVHFHPYQLA